MKILQIRFQNLNSLAGAWHIDFTDPAYSENSLFAITGPTGAGKSTLLDAICLALYGRTPRLAKITKTSNEIMSRQTGVCFAEVEFETVKGHFRCHWSQHRSRQQPGGELQQPKHEIIDAADSTVLESQIRNVATRVEEVTGMDFDRFTRSTLLAQGGFAAFLQASPDNRAPILEQITGTAIYSRLSIKVHELRAIEQARLQELKQTLAHISLLSSEEEQELLTIIRDREQQSELHKKEIAETRQKLDWLNILAGLRNEIEEYNRQLQEIDAEERTHAPQLNQLPLGLAAREIEPIYQEYTNLNTSESKNQVERNRLASDLDDLLCSQKNSADARLESEKRLLQTETDAQNGQKLIKQVRELDLRLQTAGEQLMERTNILEDLYRQHKDSNTALEILGQKLALEKTRKNDLCIFFKKQAGDEKLVEEISALEMEIRSILLFQNKVIANSEARKKADQDTRAKKQAAALLIKEKATLEKRIADVEEIQNKLRQESSQVLQGRDAETLQQDLFLVQATENRVQNLILLLEEQDVQSQERDTLHRHILQTSEKEKELNTALNSVSDEIAVRQQEASLLEKNLLLLARIRDLETERNCLQDGTPCPLCGATTHPYSQGNVPASSAEETRLQETRTKLTALEKESSELTRQRIICHEQQKNYTERIKTLTEGLTRREKELEQMLANLEFPPLKYTDIQTIKKKEEDLLQEKETLRQSSDRLKQFTKELAAAEETKNKLIQTQHQLETALLNAAHQVSSAEQEQQRLLQEELSLSTELEKLTNSLFSKLATYRISSPSPDTLPAILEELVKRTKLWKKKKEEEVLVATKILTLDSEVNHQQKLLEQLAMQVAEKEVQRKNTQKSLVTLEKSRTDLFGNKHTEEEAKRLESAVTDARKKLEQLTREYADLTNKITATRTLQERLESESRNRLQEIQKQKQKLDQALTSSLFADLDGFLNARLQPQEVNRLLNLQNDLQARRTKLQTLLEDKKNALQKEETKELCKEEVEELHQKLVEQEKLLTQLLEQAGATRERLQKNSTDKKKASERLEIIETQKNVLGRWNRLHMLIGSADGKKFRNFAQGLTFEMMINHANSALGHMNNRYILVRDHNLPLDLNVIDTYQAGEVRSTKNLSGGESFLVSLALALGLSRMASNNVRVDSLFLDEGFGTLDEETLEAALDALSQLREENKLIGIISHVAALKERIPLQIEIIPHSGGRSTIKGPGATKDNR